MRIQTGFKVIARAIGLLACASALPLAANNEPSAAEALAEAMSKPFAAPEPSENGGVLSDFRPRIAPLGEGEWVYLQRNRDGAPYRQRVLQLLDNPDGSVSQIAWSLSDPEALENAPDQPELLDMIDRSMLVATFTEGCAQQWSFTNDPEPVWSGVVDPETCVVMSQRRGAEIRIGAEARITPDGLFEAERGFSMQGEQLWGTPVGEFALIMRDETKASKTADPATTITPALFDRWIEGRVGSGDPVYWYSIGTMRSYPDGEVIAVMEGYDTARMHRPDPDKSLAHQYNRKIYIFRDPETNEVLREIEGRTVEPVAYDYQFITYELKDGGIETFVEQGAGDAVRRIGPGKQMSMRMLGDTAVFSAPVYLDFPIGPEARYQAFENYDFFLHPSGSVPEPNQLSWVRYGPAPPWAGGVPSIMHLVTWRVESFDEVPETLRTYIESDAVLWREPPKDLEDVRRLQGAGN